MDEREARWQLVEAQARFLRTRESNGFSPNTLKNYRAEFKKEQEFFGADKLVHDITKGEALGYLTWRCAKLEGASANKAYEIFVEFVKYCRIADSGIDPDLGAGWVRAKERVKPKTFVPPNSLPRLLEMADGDHPRDRAVVAVLWWTGRRESEVQLLRVGDVDMEASTIRAIRPKSGDVKKHPMELQFVREMDRWLRAYRKIMGVTELNPEWYLTPARKRGFGGHLLRPDRPHAEMSRAVRNLLRRAGYEGANLGAHTLRRSAGSALRKQMAAAGVPDATERTRIFFGHQSIKTTEGYIDHSDEDRIAEETAAAGWLTQASYESTEPSGSVAHGNVISIMGRRRRG